MYSSGSGVCTLDCSFAFVTSCAGSSGCRSLDANFFVSGRSCARALIPTIDAARTPQPKRTPDSLFTRTLHLFWIETVSPYTHLIYSWQCRSTFHDPCPSLEISSPSLSLFAPPASSRRAPSQTASSIPPAASTPQCRQRTPRSQSNISGRRTTSPSLVPTAASSLGIAAASHGAALLPRTLQRCQHPFRGNALHRRSPRSLQHRRHPPQPARSRLDTRHSAHPSRPHHHRHRQAAGGAPSIFPPASAMPRSASLRSIPTPPSTSTANSFLREVRTSASLRTHQSRPLSDIRPQSPSVR